MFSKSTLSIHITFSFLFAFGLPQNTAGQSRFYKQPPTLGVQVSFNDFKHADGGNTFNGFSKLKIGVAVNYIQGLTNKLDWTGTVAGSIIDFTSRKGINYGQGNKDLLLESDFSLRRKFLPGKIGFPFIQGGVGGAVYKKYWGVFIPAGAGFQFNISKRTFLLLNAQYRLPLTNTQDGHFFYSIGISGIIGKAKKSKEQAAPVAPPIDTLPKDTDGDGIPDSTDKCVTISGVYEYNGCPVPDSDGDGLTDDKDSCISTPGLLKYDGCPIPDSDGDKVNDEIDQCPDVFGIADNGGCPVNKDSIARKIDDAARNIFFITGSYEIDTSSFKALNEVIKLLRENPIFKLDIEGNTDNEGTETSNQLLSEQRAKAVYDYLNRKGIPRFRLHAFGYGQTRPVADNRTIKGRALNRRVEMKLK